LWSGLGSTALAFSAFLTILVFLQLADQYSRGTLIFQAVGVGLAVAIARTVFYSWLQSAIASNHIDARRVVLIGDDPHRAAFSNRIKQSGIRTVGSFDFPQSRALKSANAPSHQIRDSIRNIRSLLPDDIIILTDHITPTILELASILAEVPAGVHLVPVDELHLLASGQISPFGRAQTIQLFYPPLSTSDLFIKRAFDVIFAFIGLVLLSPLFLIISVAIKMDSRGPVFFRQLRHGLNNDEIRVLKFRSMTCMEDGGEFRAATENDPRVTRIGRIMRRTNIDELPQLINVLQGHMSIVGPRPHATTHNDIFNKVIAPFPRRHNVKPGITGWAQVNGYRGAADTLEKMKQRVEYDLQYIDNWSFLFDMKIIAMTLLTKRAYLNAY
jgi:Undecaprenyl-phosphate glucose phosphotransferase